MLWVCQGVLAAVFVASGALKSSMSKERMLASGQTGVAEFPLPVIRVLAGSELLAAAGLILPWALGVARVLTPVAAGWLAIVMVGAGVAHSRLREPRAVAVNAVLFALCTVVVLGRAADL